MSLQVLRNALNSKRISKANLMPKKNLLNDLSVWAIHSNAKNLEPYKLELNPTAQYNGTIINVNLKRNTTYTMSMGEIGDGFLAIQHYQNGNGTALSQNNGSDGAKVVTFTTPVNADFTRIQLSNRLMNKVIFANWQLEEGSVATSFEAYTGLNRAIKQAVKTAKR